MSCSVVLIVASLSGLPLISLADSVPVYSPVLAHIAGTVHVPAAEVRIVLSETVHEPVLRPSQQSAEKGVHDPGVIRHLQALGLIDETCIGSECTTSSGQVIVQLGKVVGLPAGTRAKVLRESQPGVELEEALRKIPESEAVGVEIALDVVVTTPCLAPPESPRCRVPNTISYRYFLRAGDNGFEVVTRWPTGAI